MEEILYEHNKKNIKEVLKKLVQSAFKPIGQTKYIALKIINTIMYTEYEVFVSAIEAKIYIIDSNSSIVAIFDIDDKSIEDYIYNLQKFPYYYLKLISFDNENNDIPLCSLP